MLLVDKVGNVLGDRKEEIVTTALLEKKSLTKDIDKGNYELADTPLLEKKYSTKDIDTVTDELSDMKKKVVTIRSKGLDKFEVHPKGSTGCFKLDGGLKKSYNSF